MVIPLIASFPLFTFILASVFLGDKITLTKVGGAGAYCFWCGFNPDLIPKSA